MKKYVRNLQNGSLSIICSIVDSLSSRVRHILLKQLIGGEWVKESDGGLLLEDNEKRQRSEATVNLSD